VTPDPYNLQVVAEFRAHGGVVAGMGDMPVLLLHNVGAKSGTEYVTPLVYWPIDDQAVVVLASNRGAARHPDWYHNLIAHPVTTAEIASDTWLVEARVVAGDERRTLLQPILATSPSAAAAVRATRREIPVVVLDLQRCLQHGDRPGPA
jgi:deazaflavin-dependent oxidoreductase (nitroreductase family)